MCCIKLVQTRVYWLKWLYKWKYSRLTHRLFANFHFVCLALDCHRCGVLFFMIYVVINLIAFRCPVNVCGGASVYFCGSGNKVNGTTIKKYSVKVMNGTTIYMLARLIYIYIYKPNYCYALHWLTFIWCWLVLILLMVMSGYGLRRRGLLAGSYSVSPCVLRHPSSVRFPPRLPAHVCGLRSHHWLRLRLQLLPLH